MGAGTCNCCTNMTLKIPECKRCCFCIPLRVGLIVWSCFKIVADGLIIVLLGYISLVNTMAFMFTNVLEFVVYALISFVGVIVFVMNFVATYVFIDAAHKKTLKWIRRYYKYSIKEMKVKIVWLVVTSTFVIACHHVDEEPLPTVWYRGLAISLIILAFDGFFLLLLRSEVIKLSGSGDATLENYPVEPPIDNV